jgi:hypothetical protein
MEGELIFDSLLTKVLTGANISCVITEILNSSSMIEAQVSSFARIAI